MRRNWFCWRLALAAFISILLLLHCVSGPAFVDAQQHTIKKAPRAGAGATKKQHQKQHPQQKQKQNMKKKTKNSAPGGTASGGGGGFLKQSFDEIIKQLMKSSGGRVGGAHDQNIQNMFPMFGGGGGGGFNFKQQDSQRAKLKAGKHRNFFESSGKGYNWQQQQQQPLQNREMSVKKASKLLGVRPAATKREIDKAYHRLMKKYHPDKCSTEECKKNALEIGQAREVLKANTDRRVEL